jgi:hypothetical protein
MNAVASEKRRKRENSNLTTLTFYLQVFSSPLVAHPLYHSIHHPYSIFHRPSSIIAHLNPSSHPTRFLLPSIPYFHARANTSLLDANRLEIKHKKRRGGCACTLLQVNNAWLLRREAGDWYGMVLVLDGEEGSGRA